MTSLTPADMCDCAEMLVNEWLDEDGDLVEVRELNEGRAESDTQAFLDHPHAVTWRIVCPTCHRIYEIGGRL